MGDCALLFPGQGAQIVGMAAALLERSGAARRLFDRAGEILGYDLARVCVEGPEEELDTTRLSQPAIFTASLAAAEAIAEHLGRRPEACGTAGLSLGEYSALVFSGSITFEDALPIVAQRGAVMQEACESRPGGMAAVIGLAAEEVEAAVEEGKTAGVVGMANYNTRDQIVISGEGEALERASEAARRRGARRVIPLRVAGAFHSPLMAGAANALRPALDRLEIREPRIPFFPNTTARMTRDPEEIRSGLVRQIENPMLWAPTVDALRASGMRRAVEPGPGRVVAGLVRSIDRSIEVHSVGDPEGIERLPEGIC